MHMLGSDETIVYSIWPPGIEREIRPDERDTPGVGNTPHRFVITASGYRGRPIGNAALRAAVFGGSGPEQRTEREHRVDGLLAGLAATGVSCEWYLEGRDNARENAYQ